MCIRPSQAGAVACCGDMYEIAIEDEKRVKLRGVGLGLPIAQAQPWLGVLHTRDPAKAGVTNPPPPALSVMRFRCVAAIVIALRLLCPVALGCFVVSHGATGG